MTKKSKPQLIICILCALLALTCAISYNLSGAYIDENGFLHEQFGFIPLGYLFGILSFMFGLWAYLKK